ncbi:MAG: hypothetical protein Kow0089_10270 [Desulfobulbaceae bacterium]
MDNLVKNLYKGWNHRQRRYGIRKKDCPAFHMKTWKEKISFILTGIGYLLFHLGKMPDNGSVLLGTLTALASTLPFEIAFTYMVIVFIRRTTGGKLPPWDRILRIFFTIGILFGLVYNLYIRGAIEQQRIEREGAATVSRSAEDGIRTVPSHWA